jgi:DNA polymerase III alpha subunit
MNIHKNFDIDIDTPNSFDAVSFFGGYATKASMIKDEKLQSHPCGVYFQDIPKDPLTNLSAIPYETADELGYFKVDFLHLNVYNFFDSKDEIKALLKIEPDWTLLNSPSVVSKLFQLSKHYDLIKKVKPTSILELADVLSLIRPGKTFILNLYLRDKEKARKELYKLDKDGNYSFKKAHAIAYALTIILQLHLISAGVEF